jgi:ribosomal RNA-processing protein 9
MLSRIEAPGFVNSLQVLSLPGSFGNQAEWVERESGRERPKQDDVSSVLVVAALGKEPRTGRWMHVSEPGVVNCAMAWVVGRRGED